MDKIPYHVILKILREFYIFRICMKNDSYYNIYTYHGYFKWDITRKIHFIFPNIINMYTRIKHQSYEMKIMFLTHIKYYDSIHDDIYLKNEYYFPNVEVLSSLIIPDDRSRDNLLKSSFIKTIKTLTIWIDSRYNMSIFNQFKKLENLVVYPKNYDIEDEYRLGFKLIHGDLNSVSIRKLTVYGTTEISFKHLPNLEYLEYGKDLNPISVIITDNQIYNLCKYSKKLRILKIGYEILKNTNITVEFKNEYRFNLEKCYIYLDCGLNSTVIFNMYNFSDLMLKNCKQLYFDYTYYNRGVVYIGDFIAMKLKYLYVNSISKTINLTYLPILKYLCVKRYIDYNNVQYIKTIKPTGYESLKYLYIHYYNQTNESWFIKTIKNEEIIKTDIRCIFSHKNMNSTNYKYYCPNKKIKFMRKMKKIFGIELYK